MNKYRVHEVAKDFNISSKEVSDILTRYLTPPKNHMQVLTDAELNLVFDRITQDNQIESIELVFAEVYKEPPKPVEPTPAPVPVAVVETPVPKTPGTAESAEVKATAAPSPAVPSPVPATNQPAAQQQPTPPQPSQPQHRTREERQVRTDTRSVNVDLSRFDERVDSLVPERAERMKQGKERIRKAGDKRPQNFGQKRRQEEQERMKRLHLDVARKAQLKVFIPDEISVHELAARLKKTGGEVVGKLVKMGVMASLSQSVDYDTAALVAIEFGAKVEREVIVTIEERLIDISDDVDENLHPRDPVVVVMGHVDHGKTSLLDHIRKASVVEGEFGGITQHIGAYRVVENGRHITFLDTPGHEAFTSMRLRGAMITDIAILVVAADDGIMPQTLEAISHAKSANVPIIIAINKIDKEGANPDRITQQLTEHGLVSEEWGGDTIICKVSAKKGIGIDHLLEMVLLTADMQELRANPNRAARGSVIEAKLDRGRGPVATVLVQNGTLKQGDVVIAGATVGRVRAMTDEHGQKLEEAGPSVPVEIIGLSEVPAAGDLFHAVADERMARELVEQRKQQHKDEINAPMAQKVSLDDLFAQIQQGQIQNLNVIVKADVQGSAEAIKSSLEKISNDEVRVRVIHAGVGAVKESDILLASTAQAIVVGFNVRPDPSAMESAQRQSVDVRFYRVIYDCIQEIEQAMKGLLAPQYKEVTLGQAEVRQIFKSSGVGTIAGCHVTSGKILRNAQIRIVRDGIVIHEGSLASLKRFKDDVREVAAGYECGLNIERFNDIKEGDVIEAFQMEEIQR